MAAERQPSPSIELIVRGDQALIGLIDRDGDSDVTRYFTQEDEADGAVTNEDVQAALSVIGSWSDLDWNEMTAALERIRHESQPTPPIEL